MKHPFVLKVLFVVDYYVVIMRLVLESLIMDK